MTSLPVWTSWILWVVQVLGGLVAVITFVYAVRKHRQELQQSRVDSIKRTRPYVWAELLPALSDPSDCDLVIWNSGATPARGVRVDLDFGEVGEEGAKLVDAMREPLARGRDLMPGSRWRIYWNHRRHGGAPTDTTLCVRYRGDVEGDREYVEEVVIRKSDVGLGSAPRKAPDSGGLSALMSLRGIERTLDVISRHLGMIRAYM